MTKKIISAMINIMLNMKILKREKYLIFIILIIFGWFFWFQWRPSQVRMKCTAETKKSYLDSFNERDEDPTLTGDLLNDGKIPVSAIERLNKSREISYINCLRANGISK